jgi:hypothetical protein
MIDPHCHSSSILVDVPAERAFGIFADGLRQGQWTWGSYDRKRIADNLFEGTSVFDGKKAYVRVLPDAEHLWVDYEVGPSAEATAFCNSARVIPGPKLGYRDDQCVVTLWSWRKNTQTDAAWERLGTIHEAEMYLIKGLLERGL